jgi:hypothetical protein
VVQYGEKFERRTDPWGRDYYWATGCPSPAPAGQETDLTALAKGCVSLTPLDYNLTRREALAEMERWQFQLEGSEAESAEKEPASVDPDRPVLRHRSGRKSADDDHHPHGGAQPRISSPDATRHQ